MLSDTTDCGVTLKQLPEVTNMKRRSIPRGQSERNFTKHAKRVHPKNVMIVPRGGIRL